MAKSGRRTFQFNGITGEENRAHFVQWLQTDRGYTLASLGQAWHHDPRAFKNWNQVPIPYDYAMFGSDKNSVFADRTWRIHNEELAPGIAAGYTRSEFDDAIGIPCRFPAARSGR